MVRPSPPSSANPAMPPLMSMPNVQDNLWENSAIECDASDLVRVIEDAEAINNAERIEGKTFCQFTLFFHRIDTLLTFQD